MIYRYLLWVALISISLLIGALCYLQADRDVIALLWLDENLPRVKQWLVNTAMLFPLVYREGWVHNYLSDIMWAFSCTLLITGFWVNQFSVLKLLLVGIGCAIFYETLQLIGARHGTFDIWDMFYSFIAGVFATLISILLLKVKET